MLSITVRLPEASGQTSLPGLLAGLALFLLALVTVPGCTVVPAAPPSVPEPLALGSVRVRMHGPDGGRATTTPTIVYLTADRALPVSQSPTRVIEIKRDEGGLSPAFTAAAMRQSLKFRIVDDIHHQIFSESAVGPFDLGSLGKGQSSRISFDKPGMLRLYCALHPDENAALYISPSEHFARLPASGEVVLGGLLPGSYALHTWSESAPESVVSVVVHPGSVSSADIRRPDPGESE